MKADAVVIGGGPAGSTAATLLRLRHPTRRVVLVDRETFPRHRVGASLLPGSLSILRALGVYDRIDQRGFLRKGGITYRWRGDRPLFSDLFPEDAFAWQVDRAEYDALLLERAREVGVEVREGVAIRDVRFEAGEAELTLDGSTLRTGHVIDATGRTRFLSRKLGVQAETYPLGDVAFYRFYEPIHWDPSLFGTPELSRIFFTACPAGWIWVVPSSRERASVGLVTRKGALVGTSPVELYESQLRSVPHIVEVLRDASPVPIPHAPERELHACEDWSYRLQRAAGPGWYLVGDASAFVDPVLASGIMLAHRSGLACANAICSEWDGVAPAPLHDAYSRFVRDQADGFARMAEWWYRHRDHGEAEDWFAFAEPASTRDGFLRFVAGYLCDVRYADVGVGFGADGIDASFRGVLGEGAAAVRSDIPDRAVKLRRTFQQHRHGREWLTAAHMERWEELAVVHFDGNAGNTEPRTWRPSFGEHPEFRSSVDRVVSRCDGELDVDAVVRGPMRELDNRIVADLMRLGLLRG